jgi:hypothetical protein
MSNRPVKFVAILFAGTLATASLTTVTDIRAQAAADNCLTAPKDKTPAGSHWYYRLERGTKRQCWYLKDEDDKAARAAPQEQSPAAEPAAAAADPAPLPRPPVRKSVANAHAELAPRARIETDSSAPAEPQTTGTVSGATIANGAMMANNPVATAPDTGTPSSTVATRWPDSSDVNSQSSFNVAAAEPPTNPPENEEAVSQPVPAAPVVLAAADSSMAKQSASMHMLFLVMAGALALAGITASLIFRFGSARAPRPDIRRDRRVIWDQVHAERSLPPQRSAPSMLPDEDMPMWRRDERLGDPTDDYRDVSWDPRATDDPERRVTAMLSRLARSAQT